MTDNILLEFDNVDFDYIKEIINQRILNVVCLYNIINDETRDLPERGVLLFLQAIIKNDEIVCDKFLNNLASKVNDINANKEINKTLAINMENCFYFLDDLYVLANMEDRNDLRFAVTTAFDIISDDGKLNSVYLYKDKNTGTICDSLNDMCDTKLILEETKKIIYDCINESLSKYYNINVATTNFVDKFLKEKGK